MKRLACCVLVFTLIGLTVFATDIDKEFEAREDVLVRVLIFGGISYPTAYSATGKFEGKYPEGYDQEPYPDVITDNLDKLKMDKEIYMCADGSAIQSIKLYAAGELVATGCFVRHTDGKYKVYSDRSFI